MLIVTVMKTVILLRRLPRKSNSKRNQRAAINPLWWCMKKEKWPEFCMFRKYEKVWEDWTNWAISCQINCLLCQHTPVFTAIIAPFNSFMQVLKLIDWNLLWGLENILEYRSSQGLFSSVKVEAGVILSHFSATKNTTTKDAHKSTFWTGIVFLSRRGWGGGGRGWF